MKINEIFKNEIEEINLAIKSISSEGCIQKYSDYLDTEISDTNGLEYKFVSILCSKRADFAKRLVENLYSSKSKNELLEITMGLLNNGGVNLEDWCYDSSMAEVLYNYFNDADIYYDICNQMSEVLQSITDEANLTKLQQEQAEIVRKIEIQKDSITCNIKRNEESKAYIEELEKKLV